MKSPKEMEEKIINGYSVKFKKAEKIIANYFR